jgi:flagellar FliJ protein
MKRSQRLTPIVDLAQKKTQAALIQVGQSNAAWQRDVQQLVELEGYKLDYLNKLRQGEQLSMTAQKVLELRQFLIQLDQAIAAQKNQIETSLKQLNYHQSVWSKVHSKERAMQSLVDRYHTQEQAQENKQEQQDSDERNTSQWLRKLK